MVRIMINTLEEFKERVALIVRSTGVLEKDKERNQKSIKEFLNEASTYLVYLEALKKAKADVYKNNTLNAKIAELEAKKTIFDGYFKLDKANTNYYDYYDFNELIYKLSNPKTLEDFNTNLVILINIFKEMGIFLNKDSFKYSIHVNNYMTSFLENMAIEESFNSKMKETFDSIYWKNHDLLEDIVINLRRLIDKNEKTIKEFIAKKKDNYVNTYKITESEAEKQLEALKIDIYNNKNINLDNILEYFKSGYNLNDFKGETDYIKNNRSKIISESKYELLDNNSKVEVYENIVLLFNSLFEYEMAYKYGYILKEAKAIFDKKEEYKDSLNAKNKTISELIKNKDKLNNNYFKLHDEYKKVSSKTIGLLFSDKKKDKKLKELEEKISKLDTDLTKAFVDIKNEYKDYEKVRFDSMLASILTETTDIYEVFSMYGNNYNILLDTIKRNNTDLTKEDIIIKANEFKNFLDSPFIKIIKTLSFKTEENIGSIIEERYKLFNFDIVIGEINSNTYNELKKSLDILLVYKNLIYSKIPTSILEILLESSN